MARTTNGIESVVDPDYMQSVDLRLDSYEAYINYQIHEARRAIPFLSRFFPISAARVLEIGTGRGGKGIAYARAGMQVTALDVDDDALALAARAARRYHAGVRFLAGDGTRLPFPDAYFDAILLDSVIEHVRDPLALLAECKRVLRGGGIVFVMFPPFYGPLSGHIDDFIMLPWFHLLPRERVRRRLLAQAQSKGILAPDYAYAVYASLNRLTVFRFKQMARRVGFSFAYLRVRPFLTHPGTRLVVGVWFALRHAPHLENLRAVCARARAEFDLGTALLFALLVVLAPLVLVPFLQEVSAGACKAVLRKA